MSAARTSIPVECETVKAMSDEQLCAEVARLDGRQGDIIPNYPHDLNAVHEVEKKITDELDLVYLKHLVDCCDFDSPPTPVERATARQRCEALLVCLSAL